MKKNKVSITNPEELEKNLQYTSPVTWITLSIVTCLIAALLVWACVFKIQDKISGKATIKSGEATLVLDSKVKSKLKVGQSVYISDLEGEILTFNDNEPVISCFDLADGEYEYSLVIEVKPIEYLIK
jgi:hypothetical protein